MGDADNDKKKLKLYLRFPHHIENAAQVSSLHSGITHVFLPRKKSARWCLATFNDEDTCKAARKQLKLLKIGEKKLIVTPHFKRSARRIAKEQARIEEKRALRAKKKQALPSRKAKSVIPTDRLLDLLKKEESD